MTAKEGIVSDIWIRTVDGDLLRADEVRQITGVDGLHAVLVGGSQFLVAEVEGRAWCDAVARDLTAAIADARAQRGAVLISVERDGQAWTVAARPAAERSGPSS